MKTLVLYGSETGNSVDLADLTIDRLRRLGLTPKLLQFGDATFDIIESAALVIVICSTTGQGALPINTKPLWQKLLRKNLSSSLFRSLKIATFGLGDTSYPRYNWAIKKIHNRFLQLGASEFIERGEADEQNPDGIDFVFRQWLDLLIDKFGLESKPVTELLEPRYSLDIDTKKMKVKPSSDVGISRDLQKAEVVSNQRITSPDHFQDVRHITLKIPNASYLPGDTATIYPSNRQEDVDSLLKNQGWEDVADYRLSVDKAWEKQVGKLVKPLTLRSLLTWHLDLNGIPRRSFFALATHFTSGREKERMAEFGSGNADDMQDLYDYANRPRRSLIETILEFDTLKIPIEYLLDLMPILRPRQFSIASEANSENVDLTVAIVKYKTILHRIRHGLCSDWMQSLQVGDNIAVTIEDMNTRLLRFGEIVHSVICVATGTGIAPIRSFIKSFKGDIPIYLFFGCRYESKDFLYKEEWTKHKNVKVIPAFSREGGSYVQQQISQHGAEVARLIPGAMIYVCGSAGQMPLAVREALVDISDESTIIAKEKQGLYLQETY